MPHINSKSSKPVPAVLVLALAAIALAACGSSSSGSSTTSTNTNASASATTSTNGGAPSGARAGGFTALRECLQKNGITLPQRKPGQHPGGGGYVPGGGGYYPGGGGAGGPHLPAGVTRAQYEAAIKKCGGGFAPGRGAGFHYLDSPAVKQAYKKFAACMRENGVNVPEPNTSGKGAIFSTKGLNTKSAQFTAAEAKCRSDLAGAFHAHPSAPGSPPANG
jgi:hypothetical protein